MKTNKYYDRLVASIEKCAKKSNKKLNDAVYDCIYNYGESSLDELHFFYFDKYSREDLEITLITLCYQNKLIYEIKSNGECYFYPADEEQ